MTSVDETPPKVQLLEGEPAQVAGSKDVDDDDESEDEDLESIVKQALSDLEKCQRDMDKLNETQSVEIRQLETFYKQLLKPIYKKRSVAIEKIPHFWLFTFLNQPLLSSIINDEEAKCLQYLQKMDVEALEEMEDGVRVRIKFVFADNPYFENPEMVKELKLMAAGSDANCETISSTVIQWKNGHDLSTIRLPKLNAKRNWWLRDVTFFSWFCGVNDKPDDTATRIAVNKIAAEICLGVWADPLRYYLHRTKWRGEEGNGDEEGFQVNPT